MSDTAQPAAALRNSDPLSVKQLESELLLENEDAMQRLAELLKQFDQWDKLPVVNTKDNAEAMADFLEQVKNLHEMVDDRRDKRKRPYDACATLIQNVLKKGIIDVLAERKKPLAAKMTVWLEKQKEIAKVKALVALQDAKKALDEAKTPDEVKAAIKAAKEAEKSAKGAGLKTDFGASQSLTGTWGYDVEDITKVPAKYLVVDNAAVMAVLRTGTEAAPVHIPGLKTKRVNQAVGR